MQLKAGRCSKIMLAYILLPRQELAQVDSHLSALLMQSCDHQTMTNTVALMCLVACLEVGPAQAGAALAPPHNLRHMMTAVILTTAHMRHGHVWPVNHGKRCASTQAHPSHTMCNILTVHCALDCLWARS